MPEAGDTHVSEIRKIALLNFGGIGDEILFSPVIDEVRRHLPYAHLTLFLEDRSAAVRELLPSLDSIIEVNVQKTPRPLLFFKLAGMLRRKWFDVVISSGSSSYIPPMLFLSNTPHRVGFRTGKSSQMFLTSEAPLDLETYAAHMYFSLARSFLRDLLGPAYKPPETVLPVLQSPGEEDLAWAAERMASPAAGPKILIHPGVSRVSVRKGMVKSWSPQNWAELIHHLAGEHQVFLAGGPDDAEAVAEIVKLLPPDLPGFRNLYGHTKKLVQLAALIKTSDLMVSVDSAPMHVAVGLNVPVVALFGPTDPARLLPPNDRFVSVRQLVSIEGSRWLNIPVSDVIRAVQEANASPLPEENSEKEGFGKRERDGSSIQGGMQ